MDPNHQRQRTLAWSSNVGSTQTALPSAETAAMLFWALLASRQITMRKVDGWESLAESPSDQIIDLVA
jgi:putative transposase